MEDVWCTGTINSKKVLLGCVYRSPDHNNKIESTQELINTFEHLELSNFDTILIAGDFNYPELKWKNPSEMNMNSPESKFFNCTEELFLQQLITKPTRHRGNQTSNILDLLFTNDDIYILNIVHSASIGKSDHETIKVCVNLPKQVLNHEDPKLNFHNNNFEGFKGYKI